MLAKRIIPCLDVKNGRVVKGTNFVNLKDAGDPVELARQYNEQGADELVFLDITASVEKRKAMVDIVEKVAKEIFIPFSVGGGVNSIDDIRMLLSAGADKVCMNTAAVLNPQLIVDASQMFGSQCVVVAIDAKRIGNSWEVFIKGGRESTGKNVLEWAKEIQRLGAGEILLTSMDCDGTKDGFAIKLTKEVSSIVNIPVIASGGAGSLESIAEIFKKGKADAALAASIFHFGTYTIDDVKEYLVRKNVVIRKVNNKSTIKKMDNIDVVLEGR